MIKRLDGLLRKKAQTVLGQKLPSPRMTRDGFIMMLTYFAVPLMAFLIALDGLLYFLLRWLFDICYGVWCWI